LIKKGEREKIEKKHKKTNNPPMPVPSPNEKERGLFIMYDLIE
jgi:hypothetical protein